MAEMTESTPKLDRLLSMLDQIEQRVESLRVQAMGMEKERQDLLGALHSLQHNQDLQHVTRGNFIVLSPIIILNT